MAAEPLEKNYRTYPHFLKGYFGFPVFRVSLDAGFTCPNRNGSLGTSGCIYCNNESFSSPSSAGNVPLELQISNILGKRNRRRGPGRFIAYFQSYTNTYDTVERLRNLYEKALSFEGCVGLSVGTRTDCVNDDIVSLFQELARKTFVTVEYGLQSPYDRSLEWMNRGHNYDSFVQVVRQTAARRIFICVHIILGIPGETRDMMLDTAREISRLPIQLLKIHQLQVVKNTTLALVHEKNPIALWNLDDYADFICDFLEELREDIVVQRLYSFSRPDLLIGPLWGGDRRMIEKVIHERIRDRNLVQGRRRKEK